MEFDSSVLVIDFMGRSLAFAVSALPAPSVADGPGAAGATVAAGASGRSCGVRSHAANPAPDTSKAITASNPLGRPEFVIEWRNTSITSRSEELHGRSPMHDLKDTHEADESLCVRVHAIPRRRHGAGLCHAHQPWNFSSTISTCQCGPGTALDACGSAHTPPENPRIHRDERPCGRSTQCRVHGRALP
jgi:hypothetical protein